MLDRNKEEGCLQNDLTWKYYPSVRQVNLKALQGLLKLAEKKLYIIRTALFTLIPLTGHASQPLSCIVAMTHHT